MRLVSLAAVLALASADPQDSPGPKGPPKPPRSKGGHSHPSIPSTASDFSLTHTFVTRTMTRGSSEVLWQNGPMTVTLVCGASLRDDDDSDDSVRLDIAVVNSGTENIMLYGDSDDGGGMEIIAPGDSWVSDEAWNVDDDGGNNIDDGAIRLSTGQYFAWDGESTIGYFFDDDDDKTPNSDCGFSGVLITAAPKDNDDYSDPYSQTITMAESATTSTSSMGTYLINAGVSAVVAFAMTVFMGAMNARPAAPAMDERNHLDRSSTPLQVELETTKPRGVAQFPL